MPGQATRVAVVQLDGHPAAVLPGWSDPLEDPLFGGKDETLPTPGAVAEELVQPIRALRRRVREAYCAQLLRKVTAILEACRGWGVQLVVFPEYSIPWQILDGVAARSGQMVVVAGTHAATRAARNNGVYQRLGAGPPPALEAVAPVLHHGKLLALTSKMHAAKPERGALRESERWSTIELPPDLGLPSPLGVVICLDFLVAPGAEPDKVTRDKLQQARLLAVPSWTPTHTLREFEAAAWASAARGRTPVLYANVAANGGSTIYVDKEHGQEAGRFPQQIGCLDAGDEGVVVVDVDLSDQRRGTLTQFLDHQIVTPIAQASLVYRSHPAGAAYAAWLEAQAPALANGDDGLDDVIAAIQADAAILRSAGAFPVRRRGACGCAACSTTPKGSTASRMWRVGCARWCCLWTWCRIASCARPWRAVQGKPSTICCYTASCAGSSASWWRSATGCRPGARRRASGPRPSGPRPDVMRWRRSRRRCGAWSRWRPRPRCASRRDRCPRRSSPSRSRIGR
ncbi:MAG TPA: hypothetical protein VHN14_33960 [Kofleriaceae bacterium]|jgi:predicted amidohydrolase|nr:hypothetical protein [Kofleriaceae bacterium]